VAAIGALFQSLSKSRLSGDLAGIHLTGAQHARVVDALGGGDAKQALGSLDHATAARVGSSMKDAFVHALTGGLTLSCSVAAAGAVLAFVLVEPKRALKRHQEPARQPEAAAEAVGV